MLARNTTSSNYSSGLRNYIRDLRHFLIVCIAIAIALPCHSSELKSDEYINFYTTVGKVLPNGKASAKIDAWVYEKENRPGTKKLFALWLGLDLKSLTQTEAINYEARTQLFRFDSEERKDLHIKINQQKIDLTRTNEKGYSSTAVNLSLEKLSALDYPLSHCAWLEFELIAPKTVSRNFSGNILLLPDTGLSVISDIDDTIKDSHVLDHHELLLNTFVRPFKSVSGMAELYRQIAMEDIRTSFHYVSGSPHQLYPAIDEFLNDEQFPKGSLHLRRVKIQNEIFGKGDSTQQHKLTQIRELIAQFPNRRFLLIGDSGEADPETYAEIARNFQAQVLAIYIRDITQQKVSAERYQKTFANVDASKWHIFNVPSEIDVNLFKRAD